jgi:Helix-turn-helix domain
MNGNPPLRSVWLEAVTKSADLAPITRAVAAALWSFMDHAGCCWPSAPAIAERAGCGRGAVHVHIAALEMAGLLTIRRSRGRHSHQYGARVPAENRAPDARMNRAPDARMNGRTARPTRTNRAPGAREPDQEPAVNTRARNSRGRSAPAAPSPPPQRPPVQRGLWPSEVGAHPLARRAAAHATGNGRAAAPPAASQATSSYRERVRRELEARRAEDEALLAETEDRM